MTSRKACAWTVAAWIWAITSFITSHASSTRTLNISDTRSIIAGSNMKYQVIKHLKTKTKQEALYETLDAARLLLSGKLAATFSGVSYIGQFPLFHDEKGTTYSIQGFSEPHGLVCSLSNEDVRACATPLPAHLQKHL